jgi:hypothetical protein
LFTKFLMFTSIILFTKFLILCLGVLTIITITWDLTTQRRHYWKLIWWTLSGYVERYFFITARQLKEDTTWNFLTSCQELWKPRLFFLILCIIIKAQFYLSYTAYMIGLIHIPKQFKLFDLLLALILSIILLLYYIDCRPYSIGYITVKTYKVTWRPTQTTTL